MPNNIKYTLINSNKFVNPLSRYIGSKVIYYGNSGKLAFPIYKRKNMDFAPEDKYFEITKPYEFRPDLLSIDFYRVPDFWWKIMEMNRMKDVLEFKAGRNIRIPGGVVMF